MNYTSLIRNEFSGAADVLKLVIQNESLHNKIEEAARLLVTAFESGNKVISCGNGGSHCDAMHFAEELTGRYRENRKPFPALAISDASHITCVANDYGFSQVFSRYIQGVGNKGDVLLAISTSGNSENVIEAVNEARRKEMSIILLTGEGGGQLAGKCDIEINVPSSGFSDRIQEVHIKIIHILILLIERMT